MVDAAEAVVDLSDHRGAPATLDVLQSLREKSLLRVAELPELAGELRFDMLQTIRAYAEEKLALEPNAGATLARHAGYFVAAGTRWSLAVDRADGPDALRRLAAEMPNLVAVHRRALAGPSPTPARVAQALGAVLALEPVFYMRGPAVLCLTLLDAALASAPDQPVEGLPGSALVLGPKARARALRHLGLLAAT